MSTFNVFDTSYVPNPIMDTKSTDLQKLVERYNKIEKISENKNFEWEDDYSLEDNCGWAKIKSVEQLREHILREEDKIQRLCWRKGLSTEEIIEIHRESNVASDEFLSEIKDLCVGYTNQGSCRYNGQTIVNRSLVLNGERYLNTSGEILESFREVSKKNDIIFVGIYLEQKSRSCYGPDLPLRLDHTFRLKAMVIER